MSGLDPKGPSQPSLNQAYTTPGNPVDKEPAEKSQTDINANTDTAKVDKRVPSDQNISQEDAMPTSVARGIRGAGPGEEAKGLTEEDVGRHNENEGEQMAAPAESKIAEAVEKKPGATGAQKGLESDLDRKKAEQAPAREAIKAEKQEKVDVAGVLGQTGGPANPVGKDNYPNTGSG